jgi:phosphatidylinositol glycan class T
VTPTETFTPTNTMSRGQPFFHAILPLERPCTENLTPFISLLPCRSAAGIAELLNPHKLFDANWQRLEMHVVRDVETGKLEIKLVMEVVQDPVRMTLSAGSQRRRGE